MVAVDVIVVWNAVKWWLWIVIVVGMLSNGGCGSDCGWERCQMVAVAVVVRSDV